MTKDLEGQTAEEVANIKKPKGIECPKCGSGKIRHAEEHSDHPGAFKCKSCDEFFLA